MAPKNPLLPAKPFSDYPELLHILESRGMLISDKPRALRKLASIGYYRLSGYWYSARVIEPVADAGSMRSNRFLPGTAFDDVLNLYIFDKKLRLLLSDAIERVEIHVRSILAHELGALDPTSYKVSQKYLQSSAFKPNHGSRSSAHKWMQRHKDKLETSKEECIVWYRENNREMPFWVCIEAWDFGLLSNFYRMLRPKYQDLVCERLAVDNNRTLSTWLSAINVLRNRCAHHSRVWNAPYSFNVCDVKNSDFFEAVSLDAQGVKARNRLYGVITVLWYLMKQFCPHSSWPDRFNTLMAEKPECGWCPATAMGLPSSGFSLQLFK